MGEECHFAEEISSKKYIHICRYYLVMYFLCMRRAEFCIYYFYSFRGFHGFALISVGPLNTNAPARMKSQNSAKFEIERIIREELALGAGAGSGRKSFSGVDCVIMMGLSYW